MLLKIQLFLLSYILVTVASKHTKGHNKHTKLIKLNSEQIIHALTSEGTLRYIDKLAKEFATKAAEHFIDQIRNKEREFNSKYRLQSKLKKFRDRSLKNLLSESEIETLVDEPHPDGDNLELEWELTDDEPEKKIPVIGLTKVNGRYYYRRLWEI